MYNGPHRKNLRLKNFDYSQNGYYFITICTQNRENHFGKIIDGEMVLNEFGKIALKCWNEIIKHHGNVGIDEFIIMPNHIHGIIILNFIHNENIVGNENIRSQNNEDKENIYSSENRNENIRSLRRQNANLSNVIKGFKIGVTKEIRNEFDNLTFSWQKSFHDTIIKNEEQLNKMREYIINNPLQWEFDKNNPINI
ncbi:MAG: transposase [Candidatus Gracilibacteria bacterium]|nr:transposase [Candidatus Gracilibacteria bacterium]